MTCITTGAEISRLEGGGKEKILEYAEALRTAADRIGQFLNQQLLCALFCINSAKHG
jgi:hypothetical protein